MSQNTINGKSTKKYQLIINAIENAKNEILEAILSKSSKMEDLVEVNLEIPSTSVEDAIEDDSSSDEEDAGEDDSSSDDSSSDEEDDDKDDNEDSKGSMKLEELNESDDEDSKGSMKLEELNESVNEDSKETMAPGELDTSDNKEQQKTENNKGILANAADSVAGFFNSKGPTGGKKHRRSRKKGNRKRRQTKRVRFDY